MTAHYITNFLEVSDMEKTDKFGFFVFDDEGSSKVCESDYETRKNTKQIVSMIILPDGEKRESDIHMCHNIFYGIDGKDFVFSLTERDDAKGFGVQIENVMVVPKTYPCFPTMPKWLVNILSLVFECVGNTPIQTE